MHKLKYRQQQTKLFFTLFNATIKFIRLQIVEVMRFIVPSIPKPLSNNQYHIMKLKYGTLFQIQFKIYKVRFVHKHKT